MAKYEATLSGQIKPTIDNQKLTGNIRRTAQRDLVYLVEKKILKIVAKSPTDPTKYYELL